MLDCFWLLYQKYINGWSSNEPLLLLFDNFLILYYTFRSNLNEIDRYLFYLFELYISRHCTNSFLYKCLRHAFTTKYKDLNVKLRELNLSLSWKGCWNSSKKCVQNRRVEGVILPAKKITLQINIVELVVPIFLLLKSKGAFIHRYSQNKFNYNFKKKQLNLFCEYLWMKAPLDFNSKNIGTTSSTMLIWRVIFFAGKITPSTRLFWTHFLEEFQQPFQLKLRFSSRNFTFKSLYFVVNACRRHLYRKEFVQCLEMYNSNK